MVQPNIMLDRHIELTADTRGGKPRIAGTRISVADVVILHHRLGQPLEQIAGTYDLPLAAVYAAIAYYHDHRQAVDREIAEDEAYAEAFSRANPSPLREKLRALNRA